MKFFSFRSRHLVWTLTPMALAALRPALAQDANVFPTVTIYATDSHSSESGSDTGTFTVRRTGPTNFPVAVFYQLSGSASNGVDYERLGSSVQIPAGSLVASISVKPIDDTLVEGDEMVVAQIVGSPLDCLTCGYNIGVPSNAVVVITDNDGPPTTNHPPFVQLNAPQDGEAFAAGADIALRAYAQDAEDGYDLTVEFFEGTNSLGFGTFVPTLCPAPFCPFYALVWSNVPPGQYTLTARATDSAGATSVSQPARITVGGTNVVQQPVVNIFATDATGREIPVVPPWLDIPQQSDPIVFTVTRTGPTNSPLTVFYAIGGTASNGIDYSLDPPAANDFGQHGRVTIPAGASSVNIEAWVMDDLFVEGTETVELSIEPPVCIQVFPPPPDCYLVGPNNRAVGSILDNDLTPAPVVTIVATDPDASESGPDNGTFTVSRTGDTSNPLWVYYAIGGTALTDVDYLAFTNINEFLHTFGGFPNVEIPSGASSADITVAPIDDPLAEGNETVRLQLQQPEWANYLVGAPSNAVVSIADNDLVGTNHPPVVRLISPQDGDTFVGPTDINLVAFAQDTEDGYALSVEFFEGTNRLGVGTFYPGRCATCPNYELTWRRVPRGRYAVTAKATDNGGASSVSAAVHITVLDGVNIYATDPNASEDAGDPNIDPSTIPAIFTVRRFGDTSTGIVVYYEVSGTASNGVDYVRLPGEVTIPAGASSAQIVVRPVDDNLVEGTESVVLTLLSPPCCPPCRFTTPPCLFLQLPCETNCYPIGPDNIAVAYIRDNDQTNAPPVVNIVARDPFASEGTNFWLRDGNVNHWSADVCNLWHVNVGGTNTATFIVRRQGPTDADLTVNYGIAGTASNGVDYLTLPGSITIAAGKHTAQIVVRPIDDTLIEGIETVVLALVPSADYAAGFPSRAAAIIIDNDRPRPPCVRLRDGLFHLCGPATNGFCFRVETSGDLRSWIPICTNIVTDGALHFVDPDAASLEHRFYRVNPEASVPSDD